MPITVSARDQMDLLIAVLRGLGASEEASFIQADVLTEADLRGTHSHGLQRLPVLVRRIEKGLLRVDSEPERTWTAPAVLSVDGRAGLGTAVAESSLRMLEPAARRNGCAVLAIRNSAHVGMLGYYCGRRAEEGLVCIGLTTSEALVHPYGGAEPLVGTNPIAIGIPSAPRPLVFDMATSVGAMGKIIAHKLRGEPIPPDWALDRDGRPTTDPEAALHGSLSPAGGAKGYGLGVCVGILAGLLPGAEIGRAVRGTLDSEHPCTKGDLFLVLDPTAFVGGADLVAGVARYLDELRCSRPQPGFDRVAVPGDRGDELRERRLEEGIPHPEEVWRSAERLRAAVCA